MVKRLLAPTSACSATESSRGSCVIGTTPSDGPATSEHVEGLLAVFGPDHLRRDVVLLQLAAGEVRLPEFIGWEDAMIAIERIVLERRVFRVVVRVAVADHRLERRAARAGHPVHVDLDDADVHAQLAGNVVELVVVGPRQRRRRVVVGRVERVVRVQQRVVQQRRVPAEPVLQQQRTVAPRALVPLELALRDFDAEHEAAERGIGVARRDRSALAARRGADAEEMVGGAAQRIRRVGRPVARVDDGVQVAARRRAAFFRHARGRALGRELGVCLPQCAA